MNQILQILRILRIYFDTCCYGRPRDDQTQPSIEAETLAIGNIVNICRIAGYAIIGSPKIKGEILANKDAVTRRADLKFYDSIVTHYVAAADARRVYALHAQGLGAGDSVHLAMAEAAGADFLITVDKDFERIATNKKLSSVIVINPLKF